MQDTPHQHHHQQQPFSPSPAPMQPDDLTKIFNTAIVATRVEAARDFSAELFRLMETPAFRSILSAVRHLSRAQGISERDAAESLIQTFRKVDRVWGEYLSQEGVDRLRNHLSP